MESPIFMKDLLNVLKNKRRLRILKMLSNGRHSLDSIQEKLLKEGEFAHSQRTIATDYVDPLVKVGLVNLNGNHYSATVFGSKVNELIDGSHEAADALPPHSECYEEVALTALLRRFKTYEDLEHFVPDVSIARVVSRLQTSGLVETSKEKDYVFYFRTKRDYSKAQLSPTEKNVYENIPNTGIPAQKLAQKSSITMRRTYKYLRKLKGKKLIFARKKPKTFALTPVGLKIAQKLESVHILAVETLSILDQLFKQKQGFLTQVPNNHVSKHMKKLEEFVPLTILQGRLRQVSHDQLA